MTNEEAIKGLKNVSTMFTGYKPNEKMFAMAIKALEQQEKSEYEHDHDVVKAYNDGQAYILDKIRAEIEQRQKEQSNHYGNETETAKYDAYDDCLDVIDKYREVIYEADSN